MWQGLEDLGFLWPVPVSPCQSSLHHVLPQCSLSNSSPTSLKFWRTPNLSHRTNNNVKWSSKDCMAEATTTLKNVIFVLFKAPSSFIRWPNSLWFPKASSASALAPYSCSHGSFILDPVSLYVSRDVNETDSYIKLHVGWLMECSGDADGRNIKPDHCTNLKDPISSSKWLSLRSYSRIIVSDLSQGFSDCKFGSQWHPANRGH